MFLQRQGFGLSWSRTHRLRRHASLLLPKLRPCRRITSGRPQAFAPFNANTVLAYDFVFDTTASGHKIKCPTDIDMYSGESLAIDVAASLRCKRIIAVLSRLVSLHGAPMFVRSDNWPEFVSLAVLE